MRWPLCMRCMQLQHGMDVGLMCMLVSVWALGCEVGLGAQWERSYVVIQCPQVVSVGAWIHTVFEG